MSIAGIGTDVVDVARVRAALARFGARFRDRLLTPAERAYCATLADPAPHVAARIAAKEAAYKAVQAAGGPSLTWQEVEVTRDGAGRPGLRLARGGDGLQLHLSLSHEHSVAVAFVVAEHRDRS